MHVQAAHWSTNATTIFISHGPVPQTKAFKKNNNRKKTKIYEHKILQNVVAVLEKFLFGYALVL